MERLDWMQALLASIGDAATMNSETAVATPVTRGLCSTRQDYTGSGIGGNRPLSAPGGLRPAGAGPIGILAAGNRGIGKIAMRRCFELTPAVIDRCRGSSAMRVREEAAEKRRDVAPAFGAAGSRCFCSQVNFVLGRRTTGPEGRFLPVAVRDTVKIKSDVVRSRTASARLLVLAEIGHSRKRSRPLFSQMWRIRLDCYFW
jgi:hypothetical protein